MSDRQSQMKKLQTFLTAPPRKNSRQNVIFWLSLSLTFTLIYSYMALSEAFNGNYVVQDDARQHVFWMQRFVNSQLFPNDLIADYFQSVAPLGYTTLYQFFATLGIEPLMLSKLLPPVLALISALYCFGCTMQLFPLPIAGFIGTLLLQQSLWMKFDVVSATPRAFVYPFFLAFLYYLLRKNLLGVCLALVLLALSYPPYVLIACGMLVARVIKWKNTGIRLCQNRRDYWFSALAILVAFVMMLPYALHSTEFGPTITRSEAIAYPIFHPEGRQSFFSDNPLYFWFIGERSGILPPLLPPLIWLGLLLPFALKKPQIFPLVSWVKNQKVLLDLALTSLALFFAAHAVVFRLYLPSRYIEHSARIGLAIATAILLTLILDWALNTVSQAARQSNGKKAIALASSLLLTIALVLYPLYDRSFPRTNYRPGRLPQLYEFFQQQPPDILIASLASEANNLPTFSHRSVLVAREYAIPVHLGYYRQFNQRVTDLLRAQYSSDPTQVQQFIDRYGIDFWLVERSAFTPEYIAQDSWLQQYQPEAQRAIAQLHEGTPPLVATAIDRCSVFQLGDFVVLDADCIVTK